MSTELMVELVGEATSRNRFLRKLGAATAGIMFGAMVRTETAMAVGCCNLCNASTNCAGCTCVWCWCCTSGLDHWDCCECYDASQQCSGGCPAWKSCASRGPSCPEAPARQGLVMR
jgi:hypothetical protein